MRAGERGVFDDRHLGVRGTLGDVAERTRHREVGRGHVLREGGKARREEGRGGHGSEEASAWRRVIIELHSGEGFRFAVDGDEALGKNPVRHAFVRGPRPDEPITASPRRPRAALRASSAMGRTAAPTRCRSASLSRGSGWAPRVRASHRTLLQDDAPDAAPAVMDVHPFDHDRRQVLHLQREGALDPHDERRGFRPRRRIGACGPAFPLDLERLREGGEALADDLGPGDDDVRRGEALRRQEGPRQASTKSERWSRFGLRFSISQSKNPVGEPRWIIRTASLLRTPC